MMPRPIWANALMTPFKLSLGQPQVEIDDAATLRILELLDSEPERAWKQFVESFAPVIYRALSVLESDQDRIADSFLFVCQHLRRNGFRRLRRFRFQGSARFSTWLTVVVRNLHVDWRRSKFGRRRDPEAVTRLNIEEQQVYRLAYESGMSTDEILGHLRTRDRLASEERLEQSLARIRKALPSGLGENLASSRPREMSLEALLEESTLMPKNLVASQAHSPEVIAIETEISRKLRRSLKALKSSDRLVLRLRFEEGLTLAEVARTCGLRDAQAADREIRIILERLRQMVS